VLSSDEVGGLPVGAQSQLLRALETHEIVPLGVARPRRLDLSICSATHVDLRASIARGGFRQDLYFRIASPAIELAPLRLHREEIPWLVDAALRAAGSIRAHASFVEVAMVRPWPGNVRELLRAVATAASLVAAPEAQLKMAHLPERAGAWMDETPGPDTPTSGEVGADAADSQVERVRAVLRAARGNVTHAARALGLHRNQLRRWLERHASDARSLKPDLPIEDSDDPA